jgi:hypothetical protein
VVSLVDVPPFFPASIGCLLGTPGFAASRTGYFPYTECAIALTTCPAIQLLLFTRIRTISAVYRSSSFRSLSVTQSVQFEGGELKQGDAPNYRDPQVLQYNLTVEREITSSTHVRISYVGMVGRRQNVTIDLNQIPENTQGYNVPQGGWVDLRALFPNWSEIFQSANLGSTSYNSLQTGVTHRLSRGLTFQGDYSWTKSLSDMQGDAPTAFGIESYYGNAVSDRFLVKQLMGNAEGTPRHRLLVTGTYELPFGPGRTWSSGNHILNAIAGGWNVNIISLLQTMADANHESNPRYLWCWYCTAGH